MTRELVCCGLPQLNEPSLPSRIFVVARIRSPDPARSAGGTGATGLTVEAGLTGEAGLLPPLRGWIPKPGLGRAGGGGGVGVGIKPRKCQPVVVSVGGPGFAASWAAPAAASDAVKSDHWSKGGETLWVQHSAVIKGFPRSQEEGQV